MIDFLSKSLMEISTLLLSCFAIIVALLVANKQSKIGLFQNRYEVYVTITEIEKFYKHLNINKLPPFYNNSPGGWRMMYSNLFYSRGNTDAPKEYNQLIIKAIAQLENDKLKLNQIKFLFKHAEKINKCLDEIINTYSEFVSSIFLVGNLELIEKNKQNFIKTMDNNCNTLLDFTRKQISLYKHKDANKI